MCSLITSAEAISRLLFPAATRRSTSRSRGSARAPRRPRTADQRSTRASVRLGSEPREVLRARPPARARPRRVPERAACLPTARASGPPRRAPRAPPDLATPAAYSNLLGASPCRELDHAARMRDARVEHPALVPAATARVRRRPARASSCRPTASMISTCAGSSARAPHGRRARIRPADRCGRRASRFPSARRSNARPGCGSQPVPARLAVRLFGPASSPCSRWTSASR